MKHYRIEFPKKSDISPPPMTDEDWEKYVQQRVDEEADFLNSTSHLLEKNHVR